LRLELDLDQLADEVATRVAARLADQIVSQASSPWMAMEAAIAYTRIPAGTFRMLVAAGRIPAHGGRRKLFHRDDLDKALRHGGEADLRLVTDRATKMRRGQHALGSRAAACASRSPAPQPGTLGCRAAHESAPFRLAQ